MLTIVLYEPEIPPNTGSIIRLAANTGARLALIEPLGFDLSHTKLKRAGLDYHEFADVKVYAGLEAWLETADESRVFAYSTKATTRHDTVAFREGDCLLFGPESRGLPDDVRARFAERLLRIPMRPESRSLNLSNAVSIALFEAWRQLGYEGSR